MFLILSKDKYRDWVIAMISHYGDYLSIKTYSKCSYLAPNVLEYFLAGKSYAYCEQLSQPVKLVSIR